ncbi:MAG: GNAT family N-acetyltransferase, partial [Pseudomonadota bacterium]
VYIYPTTHRNFDASVFLWVRADVVDDGYDAILYKTVTEWIEADWPFSNAAFPGRDIAWEDWTSLE